MEASIYNKLKQQERRKQYRQQHLAAGLCVKCNNAAVPDRTMCETCRDRYKQDRMQRVEQIAEYRQNYYVRKAERLNEIAGRPRPEVCDICRGNEHRIVFDHCHVKGHFRGWICCRCNRTLGLAKDNRELLTKMLIYLEDHGEGSIDSETKRELESYGFKFAG